MHRSPSREGGGKPVRQQKGPLQTAGTQGLNTESRAWNSSLTQRERRVEVWGERCLTALSWLLWVGCGRGKAPRPGEETQSRGGGHAYPQLQRARGGGKRQQQDKRNGRDPRDPSLPPSIAHPQTPASMGPARALAHTQQLGPRLGSADPVSPGWGLSICFQPGQLLALLPWVTGRGKKETPRQERVVSHLGSRAPGFQVGGRAWKSLPLLLSPWTVCVHPPRGLTAHQQQAREGQALSALRGPGRGQTDLP